MPDWTNVPGPPPPGATSPPPAPTDPGWSGWIDGIANLAYQIHYPTSTWTPQYKVSIDKFEIGSTETVAIEGSTPSAWAPDGATSDTDVGVAHIDLSRYKRTYPKITFQNYQSISVTVSIWWGSWWKFQIGIGGYYCLTKSFIFWIPIGQSWTEGPKNAYRWRQTSDGIRASVSVGAGPVGMSASQGQTNHFPNPPPDVPKEPEPNDFDPINEHPYPEPGKSLKTSLKDFRFNSTDSIEVQLAELSRKLNETWPLNTITSVQIPVESMSLGLWNIELLDAKDHKWFDRSEIVQSIKKKDS